VTFTKYLISSVFTLVHVMRWSSSHGRGTDEAEGVDTSCMGVLRRHEVIEHFAFVQGLFNSCRRSTSYYYHLTSCHLLLGTDILIPVLVLVPVVVSVVVVLLMLVDLLVFIVVSLHYATAFIREIVLQCSFGVRWERWIYEIIIHCTKVLLYR
jgi:hypothetical protein